MSTLVLKLSACIFLFFIGCGGYKSGFAGGHSGAKELIEHFKKHEQGFNELRTMLLVDTNISFVSLDSLNLHSRKAPMAEERIEKYRELLRKVGAKRIDSFQDGTIGFVISTKGHALSGSSQGIDYVEDPQFLDDLVLNIDEFKQQKKEDMFLHQHIQGNWYISYHFYR